MAFLGIGAGVASVPMSNVVSMGPAVTSGVRCILPVEVIAVAPSSAPTLGFGRKLVTEGNDLVGEGGVGGGKGVVSGDKLIEDGLLISCSTGKVVLGIVDGVQESSIVVVGVG